MPETFTPPDFTNRAPAMRIAAMRSLRLALVLAVAPLLLAAPSKKALEQQLDAFIAPALTYNVFSGVVLAAKGDEVLLQKAYGMASYEFNVPNTPETRFSIASITKRFTLVILDRLVAENKLAMTDPLAKWVPDFPSAYKITVGHLAGHRSGLRDPEKLRRMIRFSYSTAEVVDMLKSEPIVSEPGKEYAYTTANYAILGHIIERVTGKTFAEVIQQYIYGPAGMKDSGELTTTAVVPRLASGYMPDPVTGGLAVCGPEDPSWKVAGGSSYSTARDLHRYLRAFYGGKLLPPGKDPRTAAATSTLFDLPVLSSSGSFPGANANILYFPEEEVTVVVLSNNYAGTTSTIAEAIAGMVLEKPYESLAGVKLAANPYELDPRMLGKYKIVDRPWVFTIELRNGRPILSYNAIRRVALLRMSADTWFMPFDWNTLRLKFAEDGTLADGEITFSGSPMKVVRE